MTPTEARQLIMDTLEFKRMPVYLTANQIQALGICSHNRAREVFTRHRVTGGVRFLVSDIVNAMVGGSNYENNLAV